MGRPHWSFSGARINQCPFAVIKERGNHRELSRLVNDQTKIVGNNVKPQNKSFARKLFLKTDLIPCPSKVRRRGFEPLAF